MQSYVLGGCLAGPSVQRPSGNSGARARRHLAGSDRRLRPVDPDLAQVVRAPRPLLHLPLGRLQVHQLRPGTVSALRPHLAGGHGPVRHFRQLDHPRLAHLRVASATAARLWQLGLQIRSIQLLVPKPNRGRGLQGPVLLRSDHRRSNPHDPDSADLQPLAFQRRPVGLCVRQVRGHGAVVARQSASGARTGGQPGTRHGLHQLRRPARHRPNRRLHGLRGHIRQYELRLGEQQFLGKLARRLADQQPEFR